MCAVAGYEVACLIAMALDCKLIKKKDAVPGFFTLIESVKEYMSFNGLMPKDYQTKKAEYKKRTKGIKNVV